MSEHRPSDPQYPFLSLAERDRRFALARDFMDKNDLDVMVLTEGGNRIWRHWTVNQFYLSNEPDGMGPIVVFPRESEPVMFALRPHWGVIHSERQEGLDSWVEDLRLCEPDPGSCIAGLFAERGLEQARVGVIAAAANSPWPFLYGSLQDPLWNVIQARLPDIRAEDVASAFTLAALPRSPEELTLARAGARACETAIQAIIDVAKVGVSEIDLYAAGAEAMARGGLDEHFFILTTGEEVMGLQQQRWLFPKRAPRRMRAGELALFEFFPVYGGIDLQFQIGIHFGEPSEQVVHMGKVGRAAYDAANAALKPGVTFDEVWKPMMEVIVEGGCWSWGPGIHSLPMPLMGPIQAGLEGHPGIPEIQKDLAIWEWGDRTPVDSVVMEEGMLFANEPGIGMGRLRVYQGGTVACTAEGAEELSTIGRDLIIAA